MNDSKQHSCFIYFLFGPQLYSQSPTCCLIADVALGWKSGVTPGLLEGAQTAKNLILAKVCNKDCIKIELKKAWLD